MSHVDKNENFGFVVCWLVVSDLFLLFFFLLPSNLVGILLKILGGLSDFVEKVAGAYSLSRQVTSKVADVRACVFLIPYCVKSISFAQTVNLINYFRKVHIIK